METVSINDRPTLECVKYAHTNGLDKLIADFKLDSKRHTKYPNLVLLKYNMIESPMAERAVQECRGIILDENENFNPVCFPYTKFWNYGEGHAKPIDWSSARCLEKLDGSLIQLYFYNGEWEVATSGTPDAMTRISNTNNKSFREVFWETWHNLKYDIPWDTGSCYMFELCTEWNRVVVPHLKPRIVLHGIRRLSDFQELDTDGYGVSHGWETVRHFPMTNLEEIMESMKDISPMQMEGYVVRDANFNRVKIKSPQYVALHHLKDTLTEKNMLQLIRSNEASEFLNYFPEMTDFYNEIKRKFETMKMEIARVYETAKNETTQKDYAMKVKDLPFSGILFALRKGDRPLDVILSDYNLNNLQELIERF